MKNILVVGAQFGNKGAQSMLFITADEMMKRISDCNIFYAGVENFDFAQYTFDQVYYSTESKLIALNDNRIFRIFRCFLKDIVKYIIGRRDNLWRFLELDKLIKNIDFIIDISGFSLGEKWDAAVQEFYLNNIRLAIKYNIPIFMMPQSFGGFNYGVEKEYLLDEINTLLKYPSLIFAREKIGFSELVEYFNLTNVKLSTDLVLQNKGVDIKNIYKNVIKKEYPIILPNSVAVIPNMQCFKHGIADNILKIYESVIGHVLSQGKNIYIFRHSTEDFDVCQKIASLVNDERIILLEDEFSCLEYDEFIRQFDMAICSRYHGIVHAYRNLKPCILLGWAVKYDELAFNVGQSQYSFDITSTEFQIENVNIAIDNMINHIDEEINVIRDNLKRIQDNNCFDEIGGWLEE